MNSLAWFLVLTSTLAKSWSALIKLIATIEQKNQNILHFTDQIILRGEDNQSTFNKYKELLAEFEVGMKRKHCQ